MHFNIMTLCILTLIIFGLFKIKRENLENGNYNINEIDYYVITLTDNQERMDNITKQQAKNR